jgi:hypothetical protein
MVLLQLNQDEEEGEYPVDGKDSNEAAKEKVDCTVRKARMSGPDVHRDRGEDKSTDGKEYVDAASPKVSEVEEMSLVRSRMCRDSEEGVNVNEQQGGNSTEDLDRIVPFHRQRPTTFKVSGFDSGVSFRM